MARNSDSLTEMEKENNILSSLEVSGIVSDKAFFFQSQNTATLQPLYNTVRYNTALDITRCKDGSQKCIDYIEK